MVFCWACSCLGRCVTLCGQPTAQDLHTTPELNTSMMKQFLLIETSVSKRSIWLHLLFKNQHCWNSEYKERQSHLQALYQCKIITTICFKQQKSPTSNNLARKVSTASCISASSIKISTINICSHDHTELRLQEQVLHTRHSWTKWRQRRQLHP